RRAALEDDVALARALQVQVNGGANAREPRPHDDHVVVLRAQRPARTVCVRRHPLTAFFVTRPGRAVVPNERRYLLGHTEPFPCRTITSKVISRVPQVNEGPASRRGNPAASTCSLGRAAHGPSPVPAPPMVTGYPFTFQNGRPSSSTATLAKPLSRSFC